MADYPDISVVIPTFNQARTLGRVLRGFLAQHVPNVALEVVVVDDGSTDETEEVVAMVMGSGCAPLTYIRQENKGAAAARNVGITHARAPVILLCDGDVIPAPGMVEAHAWFHRQHPCLTHLALGRVEMAAELAHPGQVRQFETKLPFTGEKCVQIPWHFARGSNFSAKKEFLMLAGGFDPKMHSAAEDTELAFRLQKRGARLFFVPLAVGIHYHPMADEVSYLSKARTYGVSLAYWYGKDPDARAFITSHYGLQTSQTGWRRTVRHFLHGLVFNSSSEAAWMRLARWAAPHWYGAADWMRRQVYRACYRRAFCEEMENAPRVRNMSEPAGSWASVVRIVSSPAMRCLCRVRT